MCELGLVFSSELDLAAPRVPKDTSALGSAIAAKPPLMPASVDHQFWMSIRQCDSEGTALILIRQHWPLEASGNPSWLFKLTAKPHSLLRAAAAAWCVA